MSYKHIIGDLYEFERQDSPWYGSKIMCIRLSRIDHFYKYSSDFEDSKHIDHTIVFPSGVASGLSLCVAYEEFKELMRLWVENEMIERAQMKAHTYIYNVDGPQSPQWEINPEKPADCINPCYCETKTNGK